MSTDHSILTASMVPYHGVDGITSRHREVAITHICLPKYAVKDSRSSTLTRSHLRAKSRQDKES